MNSKAFSLSALLVLALVIQGCTPISPTASSPPEAQAEVAADPAPVQTTLKTTHAPVVDEIVAETDVDIVEALPEPVETAPGVIAEAAEAPLPAPLRLPPNDPLQQQHVAALCNEIGNKLGSVSVADCLAQPLLAAGAYTVQGRPMVIREFLAGEGKHDAPKILIMGGIHGDEYSSISIMFKWMQMLENSDNRDFHWRFLPTVNPDGLLDGQAIRQNANGVDLNRNFPSEDWQTLAQEYWNETTNRNPRRFPGTHAASEPEVQWVVDQIASFKPDYIVSVHAPYHLLDYDGPPEPPEKIGGLHLHLLGVYPGSLGNYAGIDLGIPVVTMELPSAGIMPKPAEIVTMWEDLVTWLYEHPQAVKL